MAVLLIQFHALNKGKTKMKQSIKDMENHEIFQRAYAAGMAALENCVPKPMIVKDTYNNQEWYVADGACGFAWVRIKGNTTFARTMKKYGFFRKAWDKGYEFWVSEGNQSIGKKEAFAVAFAKVLKDNGIEAYANSRLD